MRAATVVQVLQDLFYVLLHVLFYLWSLLYRPRSEGGIIFSSACLCVCLSVCQRDNSWSVRDIITKFSRHHPMVERADKFENGCIRVRVWWERVWHFSVYLVYLLLMHSVIKSSVLWCCWSVDRKGIRPKSPAPKIPANLHNFRGSGVTWRLE